MSAPGERERRRPWYREFWPWALMLPPALSVAGGATMVYLATSTPHALVVDDYARIEEITSERFERDRQAARLGLAAVLDIASAAGHIEARLSAPASFAPPAALLLRLRHATNPAGDREIRLVRFGDVYTAETELRNERYRLELVPEDSSWRLASRTVWLEGRIELRPPSDEE